ncbi:hypothetical protein QBL07_024335 (plasmid) [Gordonia rubripertincta]|uniref:hypothetical protein n=1 Tax=Gordonia TaxID=2053 RepID=UPI0039B54B38
MRHPVLRSAAAVGAGGMLYVSFPPRQLWFLAPLAIAVLVVTLRGRSLWAASGYGYLAGLGFFVPLLPWVGIYVGAVPWLVLAAVQAVAFGIFGALAAALGRLRFPPNRRGIDNEEHDAREAEEVRPGVS